MHDTVFHEKKRIVLDTLKMLIGYWEGAEGLAAVVNSDFIDEEILDGFIKIFRQSIDNINSKKEKKKLEQSVEKLNKLRQAEESDSRDERESAVSAIVSAL